MKKKLLAIILSVSLFSASVTAYAAELSDGEDREEVQIPQETAEVPYEENLTSDVTEIQKSDNDNIEQLPHIQNNDIFQMDSTMESYVPQGNEGIQQITDIPTVGIEEEQPQENEKRIPQGYQLTNSAGPEGNGSGTVGNSNLSDGMETSELSDGEEMSVLSDDGTPAEVGTTAAITYSFDSKTATLTLSGQGSMENYSGSNMAPWYSYKDQTKTIVVGEGITSLGEIAFYGFSYVTSVILPKTLTEIGEAAFAECSSLTEISLPEGLVKINDYAFQNTAITSLYLPSTIQVISTLADFKCYSLTSIIVASGNAWFTSADGILFSKDMKTLILYPAGKESGSYTIPASVETVGSYSFKYARLNQIVIPSGVKTLESGCFMRSLITSLSIPDSVTSIDSWICTECQNLETLSIGSGLKALGYQAFEYCYSLKNVTLGKNLTDLDYLAFSYCSSLKEITIPEGIKEIKNGSFGECRSLVKINFPSTLKEIWYQAFYNCQSLTTVSFPDGLQNINRYAFYGTGISKVTLPKSVSFVGEKAFPDNTDIIIQNDEIEKGDDGSYQVFYNLPVTVSYDYTSAYKVLELVNKERKARNLSALTMDKDLLKAAMTRAAETSVYFSHTRPNGSDCFTICSSKMIGENIAAGSSTPAAAMNNWMNSEGHKENILTADFKSIGVGAVVVDGIHYWVQAFGTGAADTAQASGYKNKTSLTQIKISLAEANKGYSYEFVIEGDNSLTYAEQSDLKLYVDNTFVVVPVEANYVEFESSDPSICSVASGKMKASGVGKSVITAYVKSWKVPCASLDVTVEKASQKIAFSNVTKRIDGKSTTLKAQITQGNKKGKITYQSSNPAVATVTSSGKATFKSIGETKITAKVEGNANYKSTSKTITLMVVPAPTVITKLQSQKPGWMNVQYRANRNADGYQIQYSLNPSMRYPNYAAVNNSGIRSYTRKDVFQGYTYYVRVRTFNVADGKRYYSNWSGIKEITIQLDPNSYWW